MAPAVIPSHESLGDFMLSAVAALGPIGLRDFNSNGRMNAFKGTP